MRHDRQGRAAAVTSFEAAELQQLAELTVSFLEQVADQMQALEPELAEVQAQADSIATEAAAAAAKARADIRPARRAKSTPPPSATSAGRVGALADAPPTARDGDGEARAKNRFLVERLLDAANAGVDSLDALLVESRDRLDTAFFEHLQWEVDEQKRLQNRKMLSILEVVVQRACVEVEAGQPEVALLSAALQTTNALARRELYERELARGSGGPYLVNAFLALVTDTQLELEKRVVRGEEVDGALLQRLRVIALEASEYQQAA